MPLWWRKAPPWPVEAKGDGKRNLPGRQAANGKEAQPCRPQLSLLSSLLLWESALAQPAQAPPSRPLPWSSELQTGPSLTTQASYLPVEGDCGVDSLRESSGGHLGCLAIEPIHAVPPCPQPHLWGVVVVPCLSRGSSTGHFPGHGNGQYSGAEPPAAAWITVGRCQELHGARSEQQLLPSCFKPQRCWGRLFLGISELVANRCWQKTFSPY